jgi:myosin-crossreactive antigen
MDGYLKLQEYGIEIYAAIDTYSRKIIWTYVGITARTAVSVVSQYLEVVEKGRKIPQVIRTDRGTETVLLAGAQYLLSRKKRGEDIELKECYAYGTSVANERIEAWWNQLCRGQMMNWRVGSLRATTII